MADGVMTIGNATMEIIVARVPTVIATQNTIVVIAVPVKMTTNCAMIVATALRITASVMKNVADAMNREARSVRSAERNAPSVWSGSATTVESVLSVRATRRTAPTVISVWSAPSGSATVVTAVRGAPSPVKAAMKSVPTASRTRFAVSVRTALTVWAVMKTSVKPVSYV